MSNGASRVILRTASTARQEIQDLLAGLLAAELVAPSRCIWLVSPWLRDVDLLDNRSAAFRGIGPGWARRKIRLFDVLAKLPRRGCELILAARPEDGNKAALDALKRTVGDGRAAKRLHIEFRPELHAKGLVGDDYCLSGSMNFTRNGIEHLDEMVRYSTDPTEVGALRIDFAQEYGRGA